jgi:hypothetical protein
MADKSDEFKFGVEDLADKLGIEPASARIKLRNAGVKKLNGNSYGWKTKADLDAIVEKLKAEKPAAKKAEKAAPKADAKKAAAKPAKKADAPKKKAA